MGDQFVLKSSSDYNSAVIVSWWTVVDTGLVYVQEKKWVWTQAFYTSIVSGAFPLCGALRLSLSYFICDGCQDTADRWLFRVSSGGGLQLWLASHTLLCMAVAFCLIACNPPWKKLVSLQKAIHWYPGTLWPQLPSVVVLDVKVVAHSHVIHVIQPMLRQHYQIIYCNGPCTRAG